MALANPPLAALLDDTIGKDWLRHLDRLRGLEQHADDASFQERWRGIKRAAKARLSDHVHRVCGISLDLDALFDVQAKRIHEYKRQHLNALHIVWLYQRLKQNPSLDLAPRSFIFGGKAAPAYHLAKLIITLITSIADVINNDADVNRVLRVVFVPDFSVKTGERIYPAADLSEQISTAGKEASGTGNMKFTMNGAMTIGTLDGANVEILEAVGEDNFFRFGHTAPEVETLRGAGYHPRDFYDRHAGLREAIDVLGSGLFSKGDRDLFRPLTDSLLHHDPFLVCADFHHYVDCQARVDLASRDRARWSRMSILNVARSGYFSSDRAIREVQRGHLEGLPAPAQGLRPLTADGARRDGVTGTPAPSAAIPWRNAPRRATRRGDSTRPVPTKRRSTAGCSRRTIRVSNRERDVEPAQAARQARLRRPAAAIQRLRRGSGTPRRRCPRAEDGQFHLPLEAGTEPPVVLMKLLHRLRDIPASCPTLEGETA